MVTPIFSKPVYRMLGQEYLIYFITKTSCHFLSCLPLIRNYFLCTCTCMYNLFMHLYMYIHKGSTVNVSEKMLHEWYCRLCNYVQSIVLDTGEATVMKGDKIFTHWDSASVGQYISDNTRLTWRAISYALVNMFYILWLIK